MGSFATFWRKTPPIGQRDAMVLFRRLDSLKRKLTYQATHGGTEEAKTEEYQVSQSSSRAGSNEEGPATLMSRLMRRELEREKIGGPVRQFLNRPWVLGLLLAITLGLIAWALWPMSAETMFQRGETLMKSDNPDDWETAWDQYLAPLLVKHADTPHRADVEQLRQRYESIKATRQAIRAARLAGPMSEAQWFYQEGLRRRQQGDEAERSAVWKALAQAFKSVPSEGPWVQLAEKERDQPADKPAADRQWGPVREAVRRAKQLRSKARRTRPMQS